MLVGLVQELHSQLAKVSAETQTGAGEAVIATHFVREPCPWGHHGATGHRVLDSLSSSSRELLGCPQGDSQGPGSVLSHVGGWLPEAPWGQVSRLISLGSPGLEKCVYTSRCPTVFSQGRQEGGESPHTASLGGGGEGTFWTMPRALPNKTCPGEN